MRSENTKPARRPGGGATSADQGNPVLINGILGTNVRITGPSTERADQLAEFKSVPPHPGTGHECALYSWSAIILGGNVTLTLDIFKRLPDGQPEWIEAVEGLEEAKARLTRLALNSPADYFIYSVAHQTVVGGCSEETTNKDRSERGNWRLTSAN